MPESAADVQSWASSWQEEDHPRDADGKFTSTNPVPKSGGKPVGAPGSQLNPELRGRLKKLGVTKLPAAHIGKVYVYNRADDDAKVHKGAVLRWTDDKGNEQRAYTTTFDKANAEKKWERVLKNRPKIEKALDGLRKKAPTDPASAAVLLIAQTGLRPGSDDSAEEEEHYGATTMEVRHVSFDGESARIKYIGKAGKENVAQVTDPVLVEALQSYTSGKQRNDRVFDVSRSAIADAAPAGVKLKDFRTAVATTLAEQELDTFTFEPTGDAKKDARAVCGILKAVSTTVSKRLNNTPAMARKSYIAPQIIQAWGRKNKVNPEWLS